MILLGSDAIFLPSIFPILNLFYLHSTFLHLLPSPAFSFPPQLPGLWVLNKECNVKNSWVKVPSGMHLAHRLHVSLLARLSCSFTESRGSNSGGAVQPQGTAERLCHAG